MPLDCEPTGMSGIADRRELLNGDVSSDLVSRLALYDGERDLHETLGYDDALEVEQFWDLYTRADIAKAIIDKPVEATWTDGFTIYSAEYDKPPERGEGSIHDAFESVKRGMGLHSELVNADIVSRIGRYGVLVLMLNDGRALNQPLGEATELKDVQPLSERSIDQGGEPVEVPDFTDGRWMTADRSFDPDGAF